VLLRHGDADTLRRAMLMLSAALCRRYAAAATAIAAPSRDTRDTLLSSRCFML